MNFANLCISAAAAGRIVVLTVLSALLAAHSVSAADNGFAARPELAASKAIGRMDPSETIYFAFAFPVHHQAALDDRINRIYNPKDPLYRKYMTPQEFADAYGPSEQEYDAVAAYAQRSGFTITDQFANRMMLGVKAPAGAIESAFGVHMMHYLAKDGHPFRSPDGALHVDPSVAPILRGVLGLDDFRQWKPASMPTPVIAKGVAIRQNGYTGLTNPKGGLTPTGIRTAYGLANSPLNGSGQTIGVVDPNVIDLSDIQAWEQYYGIPAGNVQTKVFGAPCQVPPPTMVPNTGSFSTASTVTFTEWQGFSVYIYYTTDGSNPQTSDTAVLYRDEPVTVPTNGTITAYAYSTTDPPSSNNTQGFGSNAGKAPNNSGNSPDGEPTLDIETQLSMAPSATIIAYQTSVGNQPYIYTAIAADDSANSVSVSYAGTESPGLDAMVEYSAFQEMAVQGQSMFAASGDWGSENTSGQPYVEDPASQPYLTAVGGTNLFTYDDGTYDTESTWTPTTGYVPPLGDATGGGVSVVWPMPGYQANLAQKKSGGPTGRNVPDVAALAGSPGISIYFSGNYSITLGNFPYSSGGVPSQYGWGAPGGTSVATPLWAGFTALVNQERYANGFVSPVGFLNYALYRIAHGGDYINAFHDIQDGYSNGFFTSIAGYDCCTGLGSMNGTTLLDDLTATGGVGGQVDYAVTTVSTPGAVSASATGVDDDGNVAGDTDYSIGGFFLPAGGSVQNISDGFGGTQVGIAGLSTRSIGIGNYNYTGEATDSSGNSHGYLYSAYSEFMQDMGYLSGAYYTAGSAINDQLQPQAAGSSGNDVFEDAVTYLTSLTNITPIGGSSSSASGINDFGEVVGTTSISSSSSEDDAFVWSPSGDSRVGYMIPPTQYGNGMTDLGDVSGSPYSTATAINDWGQVAGWGGVASGSAHALLWTYDWIPTYTLTTTNGVTTVSFSTAPGSSEIWSDIDAADGGDSYAYGINDGTYFTNDASVVGSLYPTSGATSAFIYTPTFPLTDLNSLTTAPSGCTITEANAINDLGSIAGQTTCNGGATTNAVVLNPITLQSMTAGAQSGSTIPLTITISSAAPQGTTSNPGTTISLVSSAYRSVSVPSSVTISPGATSAIVDATVASSPTIANVAITASYGSKTQVIHVLDEAPTGLTATAGDQEVALNWAFPANVTYNVYATSVSGSENINAPTFTSTTNSTIDYSLTNGKTYYFKVAAVLAGSTSPLSAEVSATPYVLATPVLSAAAGNTTVTLSWAASSGATSYDIYRGTSSSTMYYTTTIPTPGYTDTGLTNGTTYYYEVAASNALQYVFSNMVSATPQGIPSTPTGLAATAGNTQVILDWNSSTGATSYTLYRSTASGAETSYKTGITTTAYTDTGLTNGVKYYYKLAAVNSAGTSAESGEVSATPAGAPPTPTGLAATAGNAQVILNWNASTGATSYNLYRSTASGAETSYKTGITTTAYTDTGLTNGTTYYYTVAAVDSVGTSPQSAQVSATPNAGVYINCGGPLVSPFVADTDFSGGATIDHANTISTTGVTNPAPVAVYQSGRDDNFSYTIPGFTAGSGHTVRLHFCETYFNGAGDRTFNVSINGTQVLTDFDIWKTAGAENQALVEQFTENANTSGQYVITFTSVVNNALVSGIEIH